MDRPRTVFVTGAQGWLGRNLLHALEAGICNRPGVETPYAQSRIRGLDVAAAGTDAAMRSDRVTFVRGDVRQAVDCDAFFRQGEDGILFHLAGIIHPRRPADFIDVNVTGTRVLLEAAFRAGIRRAVVMSSNSPMGCNPHVDHVFDEDSPYNPYLGYGRSKQLMEEVVRDFAHRTGLETVIIRAPWFYGPFQPPRQTLFFEMIRAGKMPIVGSGNCRRSMAYLENLSQGLLLAGSHERAANETFWVADERPYTMNEIVDTVEQLMEKEFGFIVAHRRLKLPHVAGSLAYAVDRCMQGVGLYHQKIHVLSEMNKTIACSIDKAQQRIGYRPLVDLKEGMRRSLEWCLSTGALARPARPAAASVM